MDQVELRLCEGAAPLPPSLLTVCRNLAWLWATLGQNSLRHCSPESITFFSLHMVLRPRRTCSAISVPRKVVTAVLQRIIRRFLLTPLPNLSHHRLNRPSGVSTGFSTFRYSFVPKSFPEKTTLEVNLRRLCSHLYTSIGSVLTILLAVQSRRFILSQSICTLAVKMYPSGESCRQPIVTHVCYKFRLLTSTKSPTISPAMLYGAE
ncbi:hypothetical protein Tcan_00214 [Toxocara canis]|uniref:Uncharacterized protein n=1 Tax=Toxocara canis TaxID=6265 RepID=A0A0B2V2Y6_TOXCA|nr:hypothetical protein Tcan_00214 [Toxocara canis]